MSEHKRQGSLATHDLLDALERNPLIGPAGVDICGEAAITIKELEAKLEMATDTLSRIVRGDDDAHNWAIHKFACRWTLAELKGDENG